MKARCGCEVGGLHVYGCGLVGHVNAPAPVAAPDAEGLARTLLDDWMTTFAAAVRAEHGERIAQAIEAQAAKVIHGYQEPMFVDAALIARDPNAEVVTDA